MRNDHLMIVTDAGVTLHLGWDYNAPYTLDPLTGVDVDLQTAQSLGQLGTTVERQSVGGVSRTLSGCFWGPGRDDAAQLLLRSLPYFTSGTLYFGDQAFTRFVVAKTPYLAQIEPYPRFEMMLYCPKPHWYSIQEQAYLLGGFVPSFRFPVCYDTHQYSQAQGGTFVNVRNPGALPVPFTATLSCLLPAKNPRIFNVLTGQQLAFDFELQPDDRIEVYRSTTDRLAVKLIRAGVESNLFSALDEDSDLLELAAGDNLLKLDAQTGVEHLQAAVSFYPMDTGLLPEVIPCTSMF